MSEELKHYQIAALEIIEQEKKIMDASVKKYLAETTNSLNIKHVHFPLWNNGIIDIVVYDLEKGEFTHIEHSVYKDDTCEDTYTRCTELPEHLRKVI